MKLEANNTSDEEKSYKIKPILYVFTLLGVAEAFSFLNSEGIGLKIFFIFTFLVLSYFVFYLIKKSQKYTQRQIYLYWTVVAIIIVCSITCIMIKYSEDKLNSKTEIPSKAINTSFNANTLGEVHIYNITSGANSAMISPRTSQTLDVISDSSPHSQKASPSIIGNDKRQPVLQNAQPAYIEEETSHPIMDVPKGADDKKIIKPVLPLHT